MHYIYTQEHKFFKISDYSDRNICNTNHTYSIKNYILHISNVTVNKKIVIYYLITSILVTIITEKKASEKRLYISL